MVADPVDVSIERLVDTSIGSDLVVIVAKDGQRVVMQLEIPIADFARALLSGAIVIGALSPGKG
jgi:hypothetical protein